LNCPRLIEIALPIREVSAESVRDKGIPRYHISRLHKWWARRPLAASRAVVFASLIPDPDDPNCPSDFHAAVKRLLHDSVPTALKSYRKGREWMHDPDPYRPYKGIPDTLRNRLLSFIAKWSPQKLAFDAGELEKEPKSADLLDNRSLIKWEISDPKNGQGREVLRIARELIKAASEGPISLFDPFAGGGAIPLEAARLGCDSIANDYSPVAYLILRATCEFPQKYGRRIVEDVEYWAKWILRQAEATIGPLYPKGHADEQVLGYLWARSVQCSNPSCRAQVPMLRSLWLCNKDEKKIAARIVLDTAKKRVSFKVVSGEKISVDEGTMREGALLCPFCKQPTSIKQIKTASFEPGLGQQIVAIMVKSTSGKNFRAVEEADLTAVAAAEQRLLKDKIPNEPMQKTPDLVSGRGWCFKTWGSLMNTRQLVSMQTMVDLLPKVEKNLLNGNSDQDYVLAVMTYLGLWLDRAAVFNNSMSRWRASKTEIENPFDGQAIDMALDYPEVNPFAEVSGTPLTQLRYMLDVVKRETPPQGTRVSLATVMSGDAVQTKLENEAVSIVVTDPPYFDAISYADLSDFFYVWLKRSVGRFYPGQFSTPLSPKGEETTALKHRHNGDGAQAHRHFRAKLASSLAEAKRVCATDGVVIVMFAHQSTDAWTALINALFEAGLTTIATYPIETEMKNTALAIGTASLEASITVVCRQREVGPAASFKEVRREIDEVVRASVHRYWDYGFRGADLIVACYGPAVGVFGKSYDDLVKIAQMGTDSEDAAGLARQRGLFVVNGATCRLALLRDRFERKHLGEDTSAPLIDKLHRALHLWKAELRSELVAYLAEQEFVDNLAFWKLAQALFEVLPRGEEDRKLASATLSERESLQKEAKRLPVLREGRLL
jgi:adenine-specific DNA methylase